jgi:cytochrome c oxidase subunit 3
MSLERFGIADDAPQDLDVSRLPTFAFGESSPMWWATLGLMAIESTVFALTIAVYFYLRSLSSGWPMSAPPDLLWGIVFTVVLLVSAIPNMYAKRAAERLDRRAAQLWLVVGLLFGIVLLAVRGFEYTVLNCRWDDHAYGSVVWMLLTLHTIHLITDFYDTAVLTVLMFTGPLEGKRYVDVSENALYWNFVVFSWLPVYAVIYWGARF